MDETSNTMPAEQHEPILKLGMTLREKRIAMGLSVADVAAQIRLAPRQIEALEADDLAHLPELPFVRGFVRSYAKLLQLEVEPLLATLPNPHVTSDRIEPDSVGVPFNIQQLSVRQNQLWLYASAVVALLVIGFMLWHFVTPRKEAAAVSDVVKSNITLPVMSEVVSAVAVVDVVAADESASVVASGAALPMLQPTTTLVQSPQPVALAQATLPASVATAEKIAVKPAITGVKTHLRLVFDAESWAEVKDATGRLMSSKLNEPGTELNLNGQAPYELVIGNARFVQLYRSGKQFDLSKYINSTSEVARLTLE